MCRYSRCESSSSGFQQQFRHAQHGIHGRADFVAHVGQKMTLRSIRRIRCFLGSPQLLFHAFAIRDVAIDSDQSRDTSITIRQRHFADQHGQLVSR